MKTGAFVYCLVMGGIALASPPKTSADVAWIWASTPVCVGTNCDAKIAWLWASINIGDECSCKPDCVCCKNGECACKSQECESQLPGQRYAQLRDRAIKEGKPLIVGIGCDPPRVDGALVCRHDKLTGFKDGIVVSKPVGKDLFLSATLPSKSSAAEVANAINPKPSASTMSANR